MASCDDLQTVVEVDLPEHEPKLVVNSINKVGEKWKAYVSVSKSPLSTGNFVFLSDASVFIFDGNQLVDTLSYDTLTSRYESSSLVLQDSDYTLQVSHPLYETVSATLSPFEKIPIKSVGNIEVVSSEIVNLKFEIDDPIFNNYYMLDLKGIYKSSADTSINQEYEKEKIYFYSDDPSLDQGEYSRNKLLFDDRLFNGTSKEFNLIIDSDFIQELDSIQLNFWSIDYSFYQYFVTKSIQSSSGDNPIFSSEPVNVYNSFLNEDGVINGYGIFASSSKESVIIKTE